MAETPEFSSVIRRTVEVLAETSIIWPITPAELQTGILMAKPSAEPLSMVTVRDHASLDSPMMRAAVDSRLYVDCSPRRLSSREAVSWASESSAT